MYRRAMSFGVAVTLLFVGHHELRAQQVVSDSTSASRGGTLIGFSVGVPGYEKEPLPELFTVGMHATSIKPGKLGGDFAIGTMPRAFAYGAGVIGLRLGGVLPISLGSDFLLLPSAGGSLLVVGGEGGGGGAGGINAGLATVWWTGDTGVRTGITWHRFPDTRDAIWLVEFGIVRAK